MSARFGLASGLIRRPHSFLPCSNNNHSQRSVFFSRAIIARGGRWFSIGDGRQRGRFLTVAFTPEGYDKETVTEITRRSLANYRGKLCDSRTAVVLASKGVADWLSDPAFLSDLLAPWRSSTSEMDILAAVVDSIRPPQDPSDPPPSEGIAVMTGEEVDELLPGLWEHGLAPVTQDHRHGHGHGQDSKGSIEFHLPRLVGGGANLHATVPLANTVFTNGRPYTMFAARLNEAKEKQAEFQRALFTRLIEKTSQVINPGRGPRYLSAVSAPLVAITKPRKVLQGLGNILRQVEINDEPVPASQELEKVIPRLVQARAQCDDGELEQRPLTVWAAVYPDQLVSGEKKSRPDEELVTLPSVDDSKFQFPEALPLSKFGKPAFESANSKEFRILMPGILVGGGQFRQVLSGGGGWGNKKGLLSLDQESRYSTEDQDSIDDFIRSFKGQDSVENGGSGVGIIPDGSWVQFFVERASRYMGFGLDEKPVPRPYQEIRQLGSYYDTISLGVRDEISEPRLEYKTMRVAQDYFGVSTAGGLFLESVPAKTGPFRKGDQPAITTKIAVPRAEVLSFI